MPGCGYESPLEAMLQAINPAASWNQGDRPFLRDDANLAIIILTDEYDCSGEDGMGGFIGQAMPPVRLREVCESLDQPGSPRCCLQSVCTTDYGPALACLGELLQETLP